MRKRSIALIVILLGLQYSLWFAEGGVLTIFQIQKKIQLQIQENLRLAEENEKLSAEVTDLKSGMAAIEERARTELGLIKQDEHYFLVIPQHGNS